MLLREFFLFFVALQVSISRSEDYVIYEDVLYDEPAESPCSIACDERPGCVVSVSPGCECQYECGSQETVETTVSTCPNVGEACYPNPFAYGTIDNNCECSDVISCYPYCPEDSTIDWNNCHSCSDCACLPIKKECPDEPCPKNADPFCNTERNPETCECDIVSCCDVIFCPNGYEVCDSCDNCRCKEGCPDEPCPDRGPFCMTSRDPETCECQTACCSQPYCPNGFEVCDSCTNCRCKEGCPDEPCPASSPFCESSRDPETCKCQESCCDLPQCKDSGIDWERCVSCDQCPCLPVSSEPPTTTVTTRRPRRKVCRLVAPKK